MPGSISGDSITVESKSCCAERAVRVGHTSCHHSMVALNALHFSMKTRCESITQSTSQRSLWKFVPGPNKYLVKVSYTGENPGSSVSHYGIFSQSRYSPAFCIVGESPGKRGFTDVNAGSTQIMKLLFFHLGAFTLQTSWTIFRNQVIFDPNNYTCAKHLVKFNSDSRKLFPIMCIGSPTSWQSQAMVP